LRAAATACIGLAIDPAPAADDAFDMLGGAGLPDSEQSIAPRLDDFRRDAIVRRWGVTAARARRRL